MKYNYLETRSCRVNKSFIIIIFKNDLAYTCESIANSWVVLDPKALNTNQWLSRVQSYKHFKATIDVLAL